MKIIKKGILLLGMCVVLMGIWGCDSAKEKKEEVETTKTENNQSGFEQSGNAEAPKTIKTGYYYNASETGEIIIQDNGFASYLADMEKYEIHQGEYTYEDGIFTINVGTAYWKFANDNGTLVLIGYKYAGKVHNVMDESQVYTYSEVPRPGIRSITYISADGRSLDIRDDWACYDMGGANVSSTTNRVAGSYTLEDGVLTIIEDESYVKFDVYDDCYMLREIWYQGGYSQYAVGEEVFYSEYDIYSSYAPEQKKWTNREKVGEVSNGTSLIPEYGYYYSEDMKTEIVIYDTGYARYSPDTYSEKDYYGKYSIEDGMFVIRETAPMFEQIFDEEDGEYKYVTHEQVISVNKFEIQDNKLVHKEYIDYQDNINTIENGVCCTFSEQRITDRIRPGSYKDVNDEYIYTDGKGHISKYIWLGEAAIMFNGTYEMDGNIINAVTGDGDTMTLTFEKGNLRVISYRIGDYKIESKELLPVFEYSY